MKSTSEDDGLATSHPVEVVVQQSVAVERQNFSSTSTSKTGNNNSRGMSSTVPPLSPQLEAQPEPNDRHHHHHHHHGRRGGKYNKRSGYHHHHRHRDSPQSSTTAQISQPSGSNAR